MQFIAQDPEHVVISNGSPPLYDNSGHMVNPGTRRVWAKFRRGLPAWAVPAAREFLDFNRAKPDLAPELWFAFFDTIEDQSTNGWTDDERELIEHTLVSRGYDRVELPDPTPPYPTYAKQRKIVGKRTLAHAVTDIRTTLVAVGLDLQIVIDYEAVCGDQNTEALLAALAEKDPEEELVAA